MMRIAVFSKERLFLDALSGLLDRRASLQVVARETNPKELITSAKKASAQLLIVDSEKLDVDEVQFLLGARAVGDFFLAMIGEKDSDNSVDAVISRSSTADDLYESVSALSSLVPPVSHNRDGKRAYGKGDDLTRREYEVAEFVARGMSNRTIAEVSDLHEQSVKNLVSVIMRKLKCENRTQIALKLINAEVELPTD
jgi:DNA-binding NarL/FixJ family response regulator